MATILDGLQRGANRSRSYFDRQTSRRLAAEQGAREQTEFEQGQRNQQLSDIYSRGRTEGYIVADPEKGQIQLSDTFKERLADGDQLAQNYAAEIFNAGGRGKLPEGFKIDRINRGTDPDGNAVYFVGGINADGSKGVITTDGTSNDDSAAKAFTLDELFNQTKLAFRSNEGVLYGQRVVDLNDYANSRDLILANTQNRVLDGLGSNPAAQRQASAVIANAATPEEEVEVTNLLAESVGVPPVQLPATATSEPEPEAASTPAAKPAPTDNSAQLAKLEKELAAIEGRKTGSSRANVRAAERKRAEIQRLKDESEPEPEGKGIRGRVLAGRNRASGGSPIPAKVEQVIAPVVEDKTIAEIDEAVDNGDLQIDQETAAAAAQDLQEQGVETAADLAKLDPRRQAFAYAMIVASTPNDGNRVNVRNQLINILETGVSDRGDSAMKAQQIQNTRDRLLLDSEQWIDQLSQRGATAANEALQEITDTIYPLDEETGLASSKRLTIQSANTLANRTFPKLLQAIDQFKASKNYAAWLQAQPVLNQAVSFVVQGLAEDGSPGLLASLGALFNPDPSGNYDADLSNIFLRDGKLVYTQAGKPAGKPISIGQLKGINDNLASLVVQSAKLNQARKDAEEANKG